MKINTFSTVGSRMNATTANKMTFCFPNNKKIRQTSVYLFSSVNLFSCAIAKCRHSGHYHRFSLAPKRLSSLVMLLLLLIAGKQKNTQSTNSAELLEASKASNSVNFRFDYVNDATKLWKCEMQTEMFSLSEVLSTIKRYITCHWANSVQCERCNEKRRF